MAIPAHGRDDFNGLAFVTLGVVLLPIPGVTAHFFDAILSLPAEFVECLLRIAVASGNVACTTRLDAVWNLDVVDLFECFYDVENGIAMTCTQVINSESALAFNSLEGAHVARGEVADVDVVADAGAIWSVVVIAKYAEFLAETDSGLRDVRH